MYKKIIIIFILALLLRLLYIFAFPQAQVTPALDSYEYDRLGWNLASGKGFSFDGINPYLRRGPIYPIVLAAIFKLFGHSYLAVRIIQVFLAAFIVMLSYIIGKRCFGQKIGMLASIITALYPALIFYTGLIMSEIVFTFLLCFSFFAILKGYQDKLRYWYIISGVCLGLTALCRSEAIMLPLLVLVVLLLVEHNKKIAFINFLILAFFMSLVVIPWTLRNYHIAKEFIPVQYSSGEAFWIGTYQQYPDEGMSVNLEKEPARSIIKDLYLTGLTQQEKRIIIDKHLSDDAIKRVIEHPFSYLIYRFKKHYQFWIGGHSNVVVALADSLLSYFEQRNYIKFAIKCGLLLLNLIIILLGLYGFMVAIWKKINLGFTLITGTPIIYIPLVHFFFPASPRFQIPILPLIIIFSSLGIFLLLRKNRNFIYNSN